MKIEKNLVVALSYELTVDGQIADKATEDAPLQYIHGNNMLIPRFEEEVEGKEVGETFAFVLSPEEGYGEYDPRYRFDIPKESFMIDGQIREDLMVPGRMIPMLNSAGQVCQAQIIEVKEDGVTVDFNHPMAGKTLNFTGKVVAVREATEEELQGGCHGHCNGHCGGDCDGDCNCEGEGECDGECKGGCHCNEE